MGDDFDPGEISLYSSQVAPLVYTPHRYTSFLFLSRQDRDFEDDCRATHLSCLSSLTIATYGDDSRDEQTLLSFFRPALEKIDGPNQFNGAEPNLRSYVTTRDPKPRCHLPPPPQRIP